MAEAGRLQLRSSKPGSESFGFLSDNRSLEIDSQTPGDPPSWKLHSN